MPSGLCVSYHEIVAPSELPTSGSCSPILPRWGPESLRIWLRFTAPRWPSNVCFRPKADIRITWPYVHIVARRVFVEPRRFGLSLSHYSRRARRVAGDAPKGTATSCPPYRLDWPTPLLPSVAPQPPPRSSVGGLPPTLHSAMRSV